MPPRTAPAPYADRLMAELDELRAEYELILRDSAVRSNDDERYKYPQLGVMIPPRSWAPSDPSHAGARMRLMPKLSDWLVRVRLLFPVQTPAVERTLKKGEEALFRWLVRKERDWNIPLSVEDALATAGGHFDRLRALREMLPQDEWQVRALIDTNALIDNPDVAAYTAELGPKYMAHILPVVQRELDDLKRSGRTPELRESAKKADRRLKKYRDNGDVLVGARVAGQVYVRFEHIEPHVEGLPSWLDLTVPDDRFIASALRLQSAHPGSAMYVVTSDLNMQTKLAAVGMPHVEPDDED